MAKDLYFEGCRVIFKNFKGGNDSGYNRNGDMTFSIVLDEEEALRLTDEGWNIKRTKGRPEEGIEPVYHLPVAGRWNQYPPKLFLIQGNKKLQIDEGMAPLLDEVSFAYADIKVRPYEYRLDNGESGIKAYVAKGYFTEDLDEFDMKYSKYDDIE